MPPWLWRRWYGQPVPSGGYVWDYAGGMELMRRFWDSATVLDPSASELDEGRRFDSLCRPDALADLFRDAGLRNVEARAVDAPTVFRDFDDYWTPFLGGQGPAASYAVALSVERRAALRAPAHRPAGRRRRLNPPRCTSLGDPRRAIAREEASTGLTSVGHTHTSVDRRRTAAGRAPALRLGCGQPHREGCSRSPPRSLQIRCPC